MSDANLVCSMARKGSSPDNAACEGFFGRLKTQLFYLRNWPAATTEQFIEAVDSCIRWYNEKRIKIGDADKNLDLRFKPVQVFVCTPMHLWRNFH